MLGGNEAWAWGRRVQWIQISRDYGTHRMDEGRFKVGVGTIMD